MSEHQQQQQQQQQHQQQQQQFLHGHFSFRSSVIFDCLTTPTFVFELVVGEKRSNDTVVVVVVVVMLWVEK